MSINFGDHLNSASEIQFKVPREENGVVCELWDEITDFKLVWCPEWDEWFEIKVDVTEGDYIVKDITATSVGEAELSQINLYEIEINTELDISRDDYVPTVLYNPEDPMGSLLDRITEKVPHYTIGHVDDSIANIQRTFQFDGISLMDALYEIGEEIDCLFIIDSSSDPDGAPSRTINAYDLESVCGNCGHRGVYSGECPKCGSDDVYYGYGENTNIYISSDNLTDEVTYASNTDQVKNCFRLVAGDDLMTATIANCNPNGSNYLWYFSDEVKNDMPDELRQALDSYDAEYQRYSEEYEYTFPEDLLRRYNALIDNYRLYREDLQNVSNPVVGYSALMGVYYDTVDLYMYLKDEMMPSVEMSPTSAEDEASKLTSWALSPTAVTNLRSCSSATASSAVLAVAKQIVDPSYQVRVTSGVLNETTWTGGFSVTNYADEEDTATVDMIDVEITDDMETYLNQRINKIVADSVNDIVDIKELFHESLDVFRIEINKYCLSSLNSMRDICQACLDILIEQGVADKQAWAKTTPNLYNELYVAYYNKLNALIIEVARREEEIEIVDGKYDERGGVINNGMQTTIEKMKASTQRKLDFEAYLGNRLVKEMAAYRREDTYENSNFISDGLSNQEIIAKAQEFLELANTEIYKSATLQHTITSTLKNLLVMKEFAMIADAFEVGNWLTIRVSDNIYRLRLLSYEIDYDNLDSLSVEFSDVVETKYGKNDAGSILKSAASMSSSYNSVKRQASRGSRSLDELRSIRENGMGLEQVKIVNDSTNQNVVIDEHGLLFREKRPYDDDYDPKQVKIINKGLFLTDDNWATSRSGVGTFKYYDPYEGFEKEGYGVVADTLIGSLVLSEKVGIFNKNNTIRLDEDGFTLVSTKDGDNNTVFRIQKRTVIDDGEIVEDVIYFDDSGNAHFNGTINSSSMIEGRTVGQLVDDIDDTITEVEIEYAKSTSDTIAPVLGWGTVLPEREAGYYIWQRTATRSHNSVTYSIPVCMSRLDGQDGRDGQDGEPATVLRIDSSRGTVFKNNMVSTVLSIAIYRGQDRITDIQNLRRVFGVAAYLQWKWQRMGETEYGVISADDPRIGNDGFTLTISPADVDTKVTFMCELMI